MIIHSFIRLINSRIIIILYQFMMMKSNKYFWATLRILLIIHLLISNKCRIEIWMNHWSIMLKMGEINTSKFIINQITLRTTKTIFQTLKHQFTRSNSQLKLPQNKYSYRLIRLIRGTIILYNNKTLMTLLLIKKGEKTEWGYAKVHSMLIAQPLKTLKSCYLKWWEV